MANPASSPARTIPAICRTCGAHFHYSFGRGRPPVYCTEDCKPKGLRPGVVAQCRTCGGEYQPRYASAGFCSYACRRYPEARIYATKQEARMAKWYRRRARMHAVAYERIVRPAIYRRDNWTCGICGEAVDPSLKSPHLMAASLDHIIPLAKGGPHLKSNVQLAHMICNARKKDRII